MQTIKNNMNLYDEIINFIEKDVNNREEIAGYYSLGNLGYSDCVAVLEVEPIDDDTERTVYTAPYLLIPRYEEGKKTTDYEAMIELNGNYEYNFYEVQDWNHHISQKVLSKINLDTLHIPGLSFNKTIVQDMGERPAVTYINDYLFGRGWDTKEVARILKEKFDISVDGAGM